MTNNSNSNSKTKNKSKKLTDKQQRFVEEYLVDLNATQAAIRADYSEKTAYSIGQENLKKPEIQTAIQKELQKRTERTHVDQDYVINGLVKIHERCMSAEPVLDHAGEETGEYRFNAAGANKALELLGKNLKMFTEKVEHSGNTGLNIRIIHYGDQEAQDNDTEA